MLSPADAAFVKRDPVLPGLAVLLDPPALAEALQTRLPGAQIEALTATYVRYKPRTSCLVAYRLKTGEAEIDLYAKAYPANAGDKLNKAHYQRAVEGPLGPGIIVLADAAVVIYVFPNDPELAALSRLADPKARRDLLTKLLPNHPDLWPARVRRLRYKPERRYVAQLVTEKDHYASLKVYTADDYHQISRNAKVLVSRGPLRLTRRLGRSNRHHLLALEWLPGRPLNEAMRAPDFELNTLREVGAALAELHSQNPKRLAPHSREAEITALLSASAGVAAVYPQLAKRASTLARLLSVNLLGVSRLQAPIHGDFSADQVILTVGDALSPPLSPPQRGGGRGGGVRGAEGIAFLDFDRAARGDPAADLGSFAAQIERDAVVGELPPDLSAALIAELLEGYRLATGGDLPARTDLYTAAGLLHLAPHPFRNREPDWPARTEALLARAEAILYRGMTMVL